MKSCLLTDDEHAALGARLAGIEAVLSVEATENRYRQMWEQAMADKDIAVLIVSDSIYSTLKELYKAHEKTGRPPFLIRLPAYGSFYSEDRQGVQ